MILLSKRSSSFFLRTSSNLFLIVLELGCYQITHQGIASLLKQSPSLNEINLTECYNIDDRYSLLSSSLFSNIFSFSFSYYMALLFTPFIRAVYALMKNPNLMILTLADCLRITWQFRDIEGFEVKDIVNTSLKVYSFSICSGPIYSSVSSVAFLFPPLLSMIFSY